MKTFWLALFFICSLTNEGTDCSGKKADECNNDQNCQYDSSSLPPKCENKVVSPNCEEKNDSTTCASEILCTWSEKDESCKDIVDCTALTTDEECLNNSCIIEANLVWQQNTSLPKCVVDCALSGMYIVENSTCVLHPNCASRFFNPNAPDGPCGAGCVANENKSGCIMPKNETKPDKKDNDKTESEKKIMGLPVWLFIVIVASAGTVLLVTIIVLVSCIVYRTKKKNKRKKVHNKYRKMSGKHSSRRSSRRGRSATPRGSRRGSQSARSRKRAQSW